MTALAIQMSHRQDRTVLALAGDLDVASCPHLDDAVEAALCVGCRHLVVDAAGLRFCDSHGLEALLHAVDALGQVHGTVALVNVHGLLRRVLDITQTAAYFAAVTDAPVSCEARPPWRAP
ncbi:STAS domain-containing protein [Sphaerisporangium sp. NPDC051017]|uniref:STAS domain-containing protein n=1 Tax=unclassified Sphaerisporangium TaxID=2630420 RepID=UPI0033D3CA62